MQNETKQEQGKKILFGTEICIKKPDQPRPSLKNKVNF